MKKIFTMVALVATSFVALAQFTNGVYLLSEGMYGNTAGGLFWLSPESGEFETKYGDINGTGFGETSQFATVYGDNLYITSKQPGAYGGGLLTIAEAVSMKPIKVFTELSADGHNYDGRAFCGVSETKGYMGTSNGIFVIDLQSYEIIKFIEGTDCGYGVGETIGGGWYQYDVYWNQIGSMVRVGDNVFVSQQNRGILVIDAETDEIVNIIEAENFGGSFGDLVQAKDGSLWTSACTTENYSFDQNPELDVLVRIDPYTLETEVINVQHTVSVSWATWRTPMIQACKNTNRILWRQVNSFSWVTFENIGAPQICYYDIDTKEEGVLVNLSDFHPNYNAYSGFSVDPETDNVYVPVASGDGGTYGPWFLEVFSPQGERLAEISIPIGDWNDYPAMVLFTDDYAPEFNLVDEYVLQQNETKSFKLTDIVSDKDNMDAGIIVEVEAVEDETIAMANVHKGELVMTMKGIGTTQVTLKANSNGKVARKTISVVDDYTVGIENIKVGDNVPVEYFNLQGVKVENPENGIFIKKQGMKTTKVVL